MGVGDLYFYRKPVEHIKEIQCYESPACAPASTNVLTLPFDLYAAHISTKRAAQVKDHESLLDATVRIINMPLNLLASVGYSAWYGSALELFKSPWIKTACVATAIFGFVFCLGEAVIEGLSIKRILEFRDRLQIGKEEDFVKDAERFKEPYLKAIGWMNYEEMKLLARHDPKRAYLLKNMRYLRGQYLQVPHGKESELLGRKRLLARRIRPNLAFRADREVPEIIHKLKSHRKEIVAEGMQEAENLMQAIDEQTKRKIVTHIIGITTLLTTALGLGLWGIGALPMVSFVALIIGFVAGAVRLGYINLHLDVQSRPKDPESSPSEPL